VRRACFDLGGCCGHGCSGWRWHRQQC
jgi:hypothetical protein